MLILSTTFTQRTTKDIENLTNIILQSKGLSGNSCLIDDYEEALQDFFKVDHAIAVSSGTAAIYTTLYALNVSSGDEVILPVTSAVMTGLPIIALGATPVFVDCQKNSFAICLKSLQTKISKKTKAIISVPMWGYPTFSKNLGDFSRRNNIPIIEDTAQAIGTRNNKKYEGTNGVIGCFSTHEIKMISTGEGGFILTNDYNLANKIRSFCKLGLDKKSNPKGSFGQIFGLNFKLNAISAALGINELSRLNLKMKIRHDKINFWNKELECCRGFLNDLEINESEQNINGYSLIKLFKIPDHCSENQLSLNLFQQGIETDFIRYKYRMLPEYYVFKPYFTAYRYSSLNDEFPNATRIMRELLILPTHEGIKDIHIKEASLIIKRNIKQIMQEVN